MSRKHGELELSILEVLRHRGSATVSDVFAVLNDGTCYTTIMTVMSRMVKKGDLQRQKKGRQYEYWMNGQVTKKSRTLVNRLTEKVFGGRVLSMVSYLLESSEGLSDQELEEMENLIRAERLARKTHE